METQLSSTCVNLVRCLPSHLCFSVLSNTPTPPCLCACAWLYELVFTPSFSKQTVSVLVQTVFQRNFVCKKYTCNDICRRMCFSLARSATSVVCFFISLGKTSDWKRQWPSSYSLHSCWTWQCTCTLFYFTSEQWLVSQDAQAYVQTKLDLQRAFMCSFASQLLISLPSSSEFHARLIPSI